MRFLVKNRLNQIVNSEIYKDGEICILHFQPKSSQIVSLDEITPLLKKQLEHKTILIGEEIKDVDPVKEIPKKEKTSPRREVKEKLSTESLYH